MTVSVTLVVYVETEPDTHPVYELLDETATRLTRGKNSAYPGLLSASLQIKEEKD